MNRISSLLVAAAAITTGAASLSAAMVFECNFDGASGNQVTGVTGGTAVLTANATVTADGYMHLANTANGGVTITPASAANSFNSWVSANGRAINGAMDFFFRPNDDMTACRFMDAGGPGLGLSFGSGWSAALLAEPLGPIGSFSGGADSQYGRIGNMTATPLLAGHTYHAGVTFSTDVSGVVTGKMFIVDGNVAIDTSSTTGMTGDATFTITADNAGFVSTFLFGKSPNGNSTPSSPDFDAVRIYDAVPASFAAVPEPVTVALLGLAAPLGLLRRRRAAR